jgi:beta-1,4-mannosyl-glycoprotein beta-1,4-N-acetylglucosaminyltransferase
MNKNISIVTACKDRNDCLISVLPSWLLYKQVKEIIIVDWSSQESLKHLFEIDNRIKIIRVDNEKYYIPSQANNLAASFATSDYILRVDTDYFFNPYFNFFETYSVDNDCFISGEPEIIKDRDNNPYYKYLFGLLYVSKENFFRVGGYDENIGKYYSHEDSNIFERLKLAGLKQIKLKNNFSIIHIPHSDKKRYENFEGGQNTIVDEHTTVESHIGKNLQLFKAPTQAYVTPCIKWDIKRQEKNYFKVIKQENKLKGLPIVNCISLKESEDRRNILLTQFKEYNINHINFLISERYTENVNKISGKFIHTLNNGTKGCCVSHLQIIEKWLKNTNEPYGFFCEDDLSLETIQYWKNNWKGFIDNLPSNWDCIQLLTVREDNLILKCRERVWNDWGATAYILTRGYAQKIIETYCKDDIFHLELPEPNSNIQPLIENLLFNIGETYTIPLFVENTELPSTFVNKDNDVSKETLHKNNHVIAANTVLNLWKNQDNQYKSNNVKIVDCFPFFNEKELLELRINLLNDYVDEFIILDGNFTHSGNLKDYTCAKIIDELQIPKDKIKIINVDLSNNSCGPATEYDKFYTPDIKFGSRERVQRDYIQKLLPDYNDNTVFIISDCDEIINPSNIKFISNIVNNNDNFIIKIPLIYLQGQANLRVYNRNTKQPYPWDCSMFFATKKQLQKESPTHIRANFKLKTPITYVTQNNNRLEDLGWHFSWMGNLDRVKTKAISYCHYGMSLDNYEYKNCFGEEMMNFFENHKNEPGMLPVSGLKDGILKEFPVENLPLKIFSLPRVKNFLLPNFQKTNIIKNYALNVDVSENNLETGLYYYTRGHTAPALSFFLRCAERTDDVILAYEALIYGYLCYKKQKIRDETAKSLIMHAVCLIPERPEARWLLSRFYEQKQQWMDSYYQANKGLEECNENFKPLKYYKDYPGKYGLLFQKAIAGYWWGKNDECKNILIDLYKQNNLEERYKTLIIENLKKIGIDHNEINATDTTIDVMEQESIPVIGTAIVNTPKWIKRLISTIDYPVNEFVIFNNNGRGEITQELNSICKIEHKFIKKIKVCHLPKNIGCPATWNMIIKSYIMSPYWIICNHDIALPKGFLKLMVQKSLNSSIGMVHNDVGFANLGSYEIFLIKDWVIKKYGLFDENFYPGYVEDVDYTMRAINDPIEREFLTELPILHGEDTYVTTGSQTWRKDLSLKEKIDNSRIVNEHEYMLKKWGPGWQHQQPYKTPFNLNITDSLVQNTFDIEFMRKKYLGF